MGDLVTDVTVIMNQGPVKGSDSRASISISSGGSGANTAAWLARLGIETHFVGRVGDDVWGRHQVHELRRAGVITHVAVDRSLSTGTIVLLIDAMGERDMLTDRGANLALRTDDLSESLFEDAAHLHLSGYTFFEPGPRAAAEAALKLAQTAGLTTSIDPASASGLTQVGPASWRDWTLWSRPLFSECDGGPPAERRGLSGSQRAPARRRLSRGRGQARARGGTVVQRSGRHTGTTGSRRRGS